jgi:hypothetical protein
MPRTSATSPTFHLSPLHLLTSHRLKSPIYAQAAPRRRTYSKRRRTRSKRESTHSKRERQPTRRFSPEHTGWKRRRLHLPDECHHAEQHHRMGERRGLYVSASSIAGKGLFTPSCGVPRGAFLCLVWGEWNDDSHEPNDMHTMELDDGVMVRVPTLDDGSHDLEGYKWAACNEPVRHETARAAFVKYVAAADVVEGARGRIVALALHAADDIPGDTEITAHYGASYEPNRKAMKYTAGSSASLTYKEIPAHERPAAHLGTSAPRQAIVEQE